VLIAIDGPAGAGKSTVARALALKLGFAYLDSGAMYRCVALLSLENPALAPDELARAAEIQLAAKPGPTTEGAPVSVLLDGRDVSARIRERDVSERASVVAADPAVREALVPKQREAMTRGDWVAEGRDIGTVVAPNADLKIFLTADGEERARRRADELGADPNTVLAEQLIRDERDSSREHSPLTPAADAVTIDTSRLPIDEVVERIVGLAQAS
jgi:cytidylate kinase